MQAVVYLPVTKESSAAKSKIKQLESSTPTVDTGKGQWPETINSHRIWSNNKIHPNDLSKYFPLPFFLFLYHSFNVNILALQLGSSRYMI